MSLDSVLVGRCFIQDISDDGMLITVDPEIVPEQFILLFTGPRGGVTRICKIARKTATGVGVIYEQLEPTEPVRSVKQLSALAERWQAQQWKC